MGLKIIHSDLLNLEQIRDRKKIYLCAKHLQNKLEKYVRDMGKSNAMIKFVSTGQWIPPLAPIFRTYGEFSKKALQSFQEIRTVELQLNLFEEKNCPLLLRSQVFSPKMSFLPYQKIGPVLSRTPTGEAQLKQELLIKKKPIFIFGKFFHLKGMYQIAGPIQKLNFAKWEEVPLSPVPSGFLLSQ